MSKSITYSDDIYCLPFLKKTHTSGTKCLYSVNIVYYKDNDYTRTRMLTLDYGSFRMAMDKYDMEIAAWYKPYGWTMGEISLKVSVYKDSELLTKDEMAKATFLPWESRKLRLGVGDRK